jgi:hypothetical protein
MRCTIQQSFYVWAKKIGHDSKNYNLGPKCSKIQTLGQNDSKYSKPRQKCCHDIPCFGIKVFKVYQPELKKKKPHDFKVQMSLGPHVLGFPTFMSKAKAMSSCLQPSILQFLGPRSLMS